MKQGTLEVFKSFVDFHSPRSWPRAVGFYIFHLVILVILLVIFSIPTRRIAEATLPGQVYEIGVWVGQIVALIYDVSLYILIISLKRAWSNPWYILILILTLGLSMLGGMFGLIPSAVVLGLKPKRS